MAEWWRVEVLTHDGELIAIEPEMLAGKSDLSEADVETIRDCARQLLAFAGSGEPQPCFICGGTGIDGYDPEDRLVPCPVCSGRLCSPTPA